MKRLALLFGMTCCLMASSGAAEAASGRIRGYFKFRQHSGGYCDSATHNCSGAKYLASELGTAQPIEHAKIYIKDQDNKQIGTCSTSSSGYYSCYWYRSQIPSFVRAYFHFEEKDLRFKVVQSNGNRYYWRSNKQYVSQGENRYIGTITIPKHALAVLYDSARTMYYESMERSGLMRNEFDDIVIKYPDTSCSSSSNNVACANKRTVKIPNSTKAYQTFVMAHELGHVADWISNPRKLGSGTYCYPSTSGSGCGHDLDSAEWRGHALVEGMATFLGASAWYDHNAPEPMSCFFTTGACLDETVQEVETARSCAALLGRREYMSTRYIWDIYDPTKSNEPGDTIDANFHDIVDGIAAIPAGYDWGEAESMYNAAGTQITEWDSLHQWEWNQNFESSQGFNSSTVYYHNCMGYF